MSRLRLIDCLILEWYAVAMFNRIILLSFIVITFFSFPFQISAQENSTESAALIKVDHVAGFFEKINEKVALLLKFDDKQKAQYYRELTKKRFGELKYAVDSNQGDLIETLSSRYSTYAGNLTNMVVDKKITEEKQATLEMLKHQSELLEPILAKYPYESGFWLLVKQNIDAAKIYSDKINSI